MTAKNQSSLHAIIDSIKKNSPQEVLEEVKADEFEEQMIKNPSSLQTIIEAAKNKNFLDPELLQDNQSSEKSPKNANKSSLHRSEKDFRLRMSK